MGAWLKDSSGDLVSVDHVVRLTTSGSGTDWGLHARTVDAVTVTLSTGHGSQAEAQQTARDLIDSIGE